MITLRAGFRIALITLGMLLCSLGFAALFPGEPHVAKPGIPPKGMAVEAASSFLPDGLAGWIVGAGVLAFLGAYILREK